MRKLFLYTVLILLAVSLLRLSLGGTTESVKFYTFISELSTFSYDWQHTMQMLGDLYRALVQIAYFFQHGGNNMDILTFFGNLATLIIWPLGLILGIIVDLFGFIFEILKVLKVILNF